MSIEIARTWVSEARAVAALTGAGISAESGIPTFRGATGLWKQFRPEDLATPEAFENDPQLVWEWYDWRRGLIAKAQPNAGHLALADWACPPRVLTLITQNVDGLHQRAGSADVLEIHGSIWTLRCSRCEREWVDKRVALPLPPTCECGALARPGVVWFGEGLPEDVWMTAQTAVDKCDVLLVVGTSAVVYPAAGLVHSARAAGAKVIEVNPEETAISAGVDCALMGKAGEILPQLLGQAKIL